MVARDYTVELDSDFKVADMVDVIMKIMEKCGPTCKLSYSLEIEVYYETIETDDEYKSRLDRVSASRKRELAQLARLKAKYE